MYIKFAGILARIINMSFISNAFSKNEQKARVVGKYRKIYKDWIAEIKLA